MVNVQHGTMLSVNERWRSNHDQERTASACGERLATGMMLLILLGTAGCMTSHQALGSAAGDVASTIVPIIDSTDQPTERCEQFACEP
jgi:hypothetical protein